MERPKRKRFEGTLNILKFNWHFFALAFGSILVTLALVQFLPSAFSIYGNLFILITATSVFLSLLASFYIYDHSNLYTLNWLPANQPTSGARVLNFHAGFDETSFLLAGKYPGANLEAFDFYDPVKHTEVSIKRARKVASVYPGTLPISTSSLPVQSEYADLIFTILAAHEIRDKQERIKFFKLLQESLTPNGRIIVVEHLRDVSNFLVYSLGAFHFLSRSEWMQTFRLAGLHLEKELKITVFVSAFFLQRNGSSS
jgi:hypothetical protein